jgi:para-aminobenzoate synthetase/4-amino-4-deoxychorismate lyase
MQLITALESTAREAYCGIVGVASPAAGLEFNVAIRTLESRGGRIWLGAGGGIVSDSNPDAEVAEALTKARAVAAMAGTEVNVVPRSVGRLPGQVRPGTRPDPKRGVIETILVRHGEPVQLESHLARLRASCSTLGLSLPADLAQRVVDSALNGEDCALEIEVTAAEVTVTTRALPECGTVALGPVVLSGGLGAHKWADRRLIAEHSRDGTVPLFLDLDGSVLEAGHAAVALVVARTLVVPPLDGRILPSLSRAQLLLGAARLDYQVHTRSFTLDDVRAADGLLLTSALRGAHPGVVGHGGPSERATALCRELAPVALGA